MAHSFASQQWIDAVWAELRTDDAVRTHGVTWAHGPLLLVVDPTPGDGFPERVAMRLDMHEGEARDLRLAGPTDSRLSPFAMAAPFARWKAVFRGEEDIVDGVLRSSFRMRGDLPTLARHNELLRAVAAAAGRVPTVWQDEQAVEDAPGAPAGAAR